MQGQNSSQRSTTQNKASFVCDICGIYKGKLKQAIIFHKKRVHNVGKESVYDCVFCFKKLCSSSRLEEHLRSHTKERPFFCKICPNECSLLISLKRHRKIHDGIQQQLRCKVCSKKFCGSQGLKRHYQRKHDVGNINKQHECDICPKTFYSKQELQLHKVVHTKEKPHRCELCSKCFSRHRYMERHMLTHTGEQPYPCKICPKRFICATSLLFHTKTVHKREELEFKCQNCGKAFVTKQKLERHNLSHTREKPFVCQTCGKRFNNTSNLNRHSRLHNKFPIEKTSM